MPAAPRFRLPACFPGRLAAPVTAAALALSLSLAGLTGLAGPAAAQSAGYAGTYSWRPGDARPRPRPALRSMAVPARTPVTAPARTVARPSAQLAAAPLPAPAPSQQTRMLRLRVFGAAR